MKKNEQFFVQATLTSEQARVVVDALDLYSRVHIGQFNIIAEQFMKIDRTEELNMLLTRARQICFPELSASLGHSYGIVACPTESGRIAWDVHQVIRRTEAYGRAPEGGMGVQFNTPMFVSKSVPRPVAKNVNILDRLADI